MREERFQQMERFNLENHGLIHDRAAFSGQEPDFNRAINMKGEEEVPGSLQGGMGPENCRGMKAGL